MYLSRRLEGHSQYVTSITATHDTTPATSRILTGAEAAEMCVWSGHDGSLIKQLRRPNEEDDFMAIECSKLNTDIFYASLGTRILAYDLRSLDEPFEEINVTDEEINSIVLNEAEKFLAIADDTGAVKIYDLCSKSIYRTLRKHTNICSSVLFRPQRPQELLSGGYDHRLLQWEFTRARCFCDIDVTHFGGMDTPSDAITLNPPQIHSLAISSNGERVACGLENSVVLLMDASRRNLAWMCNLRGHRKGVSQVHFPRHSNHLLVSAGNDNQLCLWNLNQHLPINHSNGHTHPSESANENASNPTNENVSNYDNPNFRNLSNSNESVLNSSNRNQAVSNSSNRNRPRSNRTNRNHSSPINQEPIFRMQCEENFNWLSSGVVGGVNFLLVAGNSTSPFVYRFRDDY